MTFEEVFEPLAAAILAANPAPAVSEDIEANKEIWYVYRQKITILMNEAEKEATSIIS